MYKETVHNIPIVPNGTESAKSVRNDSVITGAYEHSLNRTRERKMSVRMPIHFIQ